jgi:hypothetical protein
VEFCTDPQLLNLSISPAQRTLLKSIYALDLDPEELDLFRSCTGRNTPPTSPMSEVTVVAGARSGKDSRIAAPIALYEAIFGGHGRHVSKGERAVVPLVAQDSRGAKIAFGYCKDYLLGSPLLRTKLADEPLASELTLVNGLSVVCFPCTLKSLRGWSIPCAVLDEISFWRLEGAADSDIEVQTSVRRGMISFPHTRLVKISTPYLRSGVLHDDFRRAWGQDDPDLLVWRASSLLMNPSLRAERLERERRLDPQRFAREYEAEFVDDLESFLSRHWIDAAIAPGRYLLSPRPAEFVYFAAIDASGGGADAFTMAIVHLEGFGPELRIVQDFIRGWSKPRSGKLNLEEVTAQIAATLKTYNVQAVLSDRYAGQWVPESFARHGILVQPAEVDKSVAYLELEPCLAAGRLELLDHQQQTRELSLLERRARPGGKTVIDHPRGSHDDHANALALAVYSGLLASRFQIDLEPSEEELATIRRMMRFPGQFYGIPESEMGSTFGGPSFPW